MTECVAHGCITCGDEAVPMVVLQVDPERGLALCRDPTGAHSSVETALVEPVARGETLLVHAGTALGRAARRDLDRVLPDAVDRVFPDAAEAQAPGGAAQRHADQIVPAAEAQVPA